MSATAPQDPTLPPSRRRTFIAVRREEALEADTRPLGEDDDLPVLTDIVAPADSDSDSNALAEMSEPVSQGSPALPEPPQAVPAVSAPPLPSTPDIEALAIQMAAAVSRQVAYELPTLLEATLLNASLELRSGLTATMEAALRDFIARWEPPEDFTDKP